MKLKSRFAYCITLFTMFCLLNGILGISGIADNYVHAMKPEVNSSLPPVQLFDMRQERIVKTIPNTEQFQTEAKKWLASTTGLSPQISIGERCGYIVRIPLRGAVSVPLQNASLSVNDVFLLYCPDKEPLLLVFSADRKPFMLQFSANVKPFMEQLLQPSSPGSTRE
ncbi:type IV secretion system protein VirB6 [Paenibacillus sp. 481]|nr:type IV secretion system protein VirB6 [Paenibacillus sp. 481]